MIETELGKLNIGYNFSLVLPTRDDADEIIELILELGRSAERFTVADIHNVIGGIITDEIDTRWGWIQFGDIHAILVDNGYKVNLPRPEELDKEIVMAADTYTTWRVSSRTEGPRYIYDVEELKAIQHQTDGEVKVFGPFQQWKFIKDNELTYEDMKKFEEWANDYGITPKLLSQATKESKRALIQRWYDWCNSIHTPVQ